jgi:two-component system response regulator AtoC
MPPLRERSEDIPLLVKAFLDKYTVAYNRQLPSLSPASMQKLIAFPWPGNVRQLQNLVKQVVVRGDEGVIDELLVQPQPGHPSLNAPPVRAEIPTTAATTAPAGYSLKARVGAAVEHEERQLIGEVLRKTNWNRRKASDVLEISYRSLLYKIKEYGLSRSEL